MTADADVVVVGAGSAGAVVAARASEDPDRTVLLLEAGPDYPDLSNLPADLRHGGDNSYVDHDWGLAYTPTHDRSHPLPRGRVTGGSSAVNTCIFLRGVPDDYDRWAAAGNPEWAWEHVLPAFVRLERDLDFGEAPYHGDCGPVPVRRHPHHELVPLHAAWLATAADLGYPSCPDHNAPQAWGAGPQPMNKVEGVRVSVATAYLAAARSRPNLVIRPHTTTVRVLVQRGRATGVEVVDARGQAEQIRARLVVLSAGAIHTPGVLVRSGIGDPPELGRLGIDTVADVPGVGANLYDHPALAVLCVPTDPALVDRSQPIIQTILRYTAPGSEHAMDLQIEQLSFAARPGQFGVAAVLEQVHGAGQVRQTSADPASPPVIESRFCEHPDDAHRLAVAYADALRFVHHGPLQDMVEAIAFPRDPGHLDHDGLVALVCRYAGSGFHPCGTARMGPAGDPGAVVDQYGRCHAVDGLAVADASIMPCVPRANTNPTAIMIGERIGEWLRCRPALYGL